MVSHVGISGSPSDLHINVGSADHVRDPPKKVRTGTYHADPYDQHLFWFI
jgi:hypothetical protein